MTVKTKRTIWLLATALISADADAQVTYYEELPYFQVSDSPFAERIARGEGYLEDFEDHELNTPNVVSWDHPRPGTLQIGRPHLSSQNRQVTWSVDEDDGLNGDFIGAGDSASNPMNSDVCRPGSAL